MVLLRVSYKPILSSPAHVLIETRPSLVALSDEYMLTFVCATLEKTVNLQENVDPELLTSMREGLPGSL